MQWMNVMISHFSFMLGAVQFIWVFNVFWSMYKGKKAVDNPWEANTLEWTAPTPPPHGNFTEAPVAYRGPYEYSHPDYDSDWKSQAEK